MLSRRAFILSGAAAGGGLIVAYGAYRLDDGDAVLKFAASGRPAFPLNAWIKIATDGDIICAIHRAEMGQGITTGIAQLLIEELDAEWSRARFEFSPIDRDYYNFAIIDDGRPFGDPDASWWAGTGTWAMRQLFHAIGMSLTAASTSTIDAWDTVRPAAAAARQMLIAAAAQNWRCEPQSLRTEPGAVVDDAGGRRATYGELAEAAARQKPPADPPLKSRADYRIVGTDVPRLDTRTKVDGTARFGIDVIHPEMLFATVVHSPVAGTRVATFDPGGGASMPGVEGVVPAGEFAVAVVAKNTWTALRAARELRVEPNLAAPDAAAGVAIELVDTDGLADEYLRMLDEPADVIVLDAGQAAAVIDAAEVAVDVAYEVPFLPHECMEPMNCTALYTGDALEVWAPTQGNSIARNAVAVIAGLDNDQVTLHTTFLGGGFGRRAEVDFAVQATAVAMQFPGRPIKLTWSRRQDIRHDAFRPMAVARVRGAVDEGGALVAMDFAVATQSVSASYNDRTPSPRNVDERDDPYVVAPADDPIYPIANLRVGYVPVHLHIPAGYWRSVGYTSNPFFIECFMDELAFAAGSDPLEFRRRALAGKTRHLAVLDALEDALDADPGHPGHGRGFALVETHGSIVAHAIDVDTRDGRFERVSRVVCVVDCGIALHPDNIVAQMEGCVFDGLAAALFGAVEFTDGIAEQRDFDIYARYKLADQPPIHVVLLQNSDRPGGIGEVGLPGVAPALCNALFAATGVRLRKLPVVAANA